MMAATAIAAMRPSIRGNDGVQNYAYVRSAVIDHDLDFTNDYAHYMALQPVWFDNRELARDPVTGLPINLYGVGCALLWSPWVVTAHGLTSALSPVWGPADGFGRPYETAVGLATCAYASLGLWFLFATLRTRFGDERSVWAIALVWLGSPLFFYMYLHPSMSHGNAFFLSAATLAVASGGDGLRRRAAAGAIAGFMALNRFQDVALLAFVPVFDIARRRLRADGGAGLTPPPAPASRVLAGYALAAAAAILAFSPQTVAWKVLQGTALSGPRAYTTQGRLNPFAPVHLLDGLFSAHHGLFHWHPALLLGLVGLLIAPGRAGALKLAALAAFAAQAYVIGCWSHWSAGSSFGQRMFISAFPFLAVGAAAAMGSVKGRGRPWGIVARVTVIAAVFWNVGLMAQFGFGLIPRQKPVPISTLAYNNAVRLPAMAWARLTGGATPDTPLTNPDDPMPAP